MVGELTELRGEEGPRMNIHGLSSSPSGYYWKGMLSPFLYVAAIVSTVFSAWIAVAVYALAAVIWLIPDRRIERVLAEE